LPGGATPTTVTDPFHIYDSANPDDGSDIAHGAPGERGFTLELKDEPTREAVTDQFAGFR
jgi:hypothetical protein